MNRLIFTIIVLFFFNNCSLNENSRIWKDKKNKLETDKKTTKVFVEDQVNVDEFNRNLKLDLSPAHLAEYIPGSFLRTSISFSFKKVLLGS